ncbi:MAG: acyl-ACP--UDP-N-acetylglucosamine O-acyltransferase [Planctomycetales bacterium]|nr:acyl-ACP--UDP-N-acetylglucosamine O-acyltransferase [Planctomycetales bacterium]MCA9169352.1 acyl-ACP--UDP-N-acetylglucosamine O-acyltransferase [Planctomycetales bacterium]
MTQIHPTCVISPRAQLGRGVTAGAYCVIEDDVVIGDDCHLDPHVVVLSGTRLGIGNFIGGGSILGGRPQHKQALDAPGLLRVGDHNTIREHVTIHRGLKPGADTHLGSGNLLMVNAHVAHDCHIGDNTILANNVMLAGHVHVDNNAYLSGAVGVHQFCRVGSFAMVGGQAHIVKDVPPFVTVDGLSSLIVGLNRVGLRRAGATREELDQLKQAYRIAFRSGLRWEECLKALQQQFPTGRAAELHQFMAQTTRGCIQERSVPRQATIRLHDAARAA